MRPQIGSQAPEGKTKMHAKIKKKERKKKTSSSEQIKVDKTYYMVTSIIVTMKAVLYLLKHVIVVQELCT